MKTKFHFLRLCFLGVFAVGAVAFTQTNFKKQIDQHELDTCSITVAADKMNVFYIGVDNPISISASALACKDLVVKGEGVEIIGRNGNYIAKATKPGPAKIIVSGEGVATVTTDFRVKRIPDPIVRLGGTMTDGVIASGEMQAQKGLIAMIDNFDFDARCDVQSYTLYYTAVNQNPIEIKGIGSSFTGTVLATIQAAKTGDQYQFIDVRAKCPGDGCGRSLNGLAFKIK